MLAKGKGVHREVESEGLEPVGFPEAKFRADEQKPHIRHCKADEFAKQNEIPKGREGRKQIPVLLPEPCIVDAAAIWDEGYRLLPGEVWTVCTRMEIPSNPYSDV